MGPKNPLRIFLTKIVKADWFENLILFCILLSSIIIALDGPTSDKSTDLWKALDAVDTVLVLIFSVEMFMKWGALGLYCESPEAYFKDNWNWLDAALVLTSWIGLLELAGPETSSFRTLRAMRTLRPLRTIQRAPGLKIVVNVCFACMPTFINICMVVLFFFLVFAIMGVQFFKGKFWACNDDSVAGVSECVGTFLVDGVATDREWVNQKMNFDNVGTAMLTLYEVAGLEMWLDVMYAGMDITEVGLQPQKEVNFAAALYFVVFIVIGVFLVLNLFVSAVVGKFEDLKAEDNGMNPLLTDEQKEYTESMSNVIKTRPFRKPIPPRDVEPWMGEWMYAIRMRAYRITMWDRTGRNLGTSFDMFVSGLVLINVLVMGLGTYTRVAPGELYAQGSQELEDVQKSSYHDALNAVNNTFTWIFLVELILKVAAWGFAQYFIDYCNQVDFLLVVCSVAGFIVENVLKDAFPLNPTVFRIIRLSRLTRALRTIRVMKSIKGVAKLIDTLVMALPAMGNVASLLFLAIFIFTSLGMSFFGDMPTDQDYINGMYNEHVNFKYVV